MRKSWLVSLVLLACLGISGTVGATTLTEAQLAVHNHGIYRSAGGAGNANIGNGPDPRTSYSTTEYTGSNGSHTHSLAASTGAANNLSPYYALAYVMRIA